MAQGPQQLFCRFTAQRAPDSVPQGKTQLLAQAAQSGKWVLLLRSTKHMV